jgi:hypothetical protein
MAALGSADRPRELCPRTIGSVAGMTDPDLATRCEALAAAKGGELVGPSRTSDGYRILIVVPPGADPETADPDRVFFGGGSDADAAMRELLRHHS